MACMVSITSLCAHAWCAARFHSFSRASNAAGHAGQMSVFLLMLTCFMAIHSNLVLLLLLGLPFDRQLPWHKLMALSTIFHSTLHLLAFYIGGRSDTMPDAAERYHLFDVWNRAYGMEVSGALPATVLSWASTTPPCTHPLRGQLTHRSTALT